MGHLGVIPASLANVEAKLGQADDGIPYKVYTLGGPDAKKQARTIFKAGPLLQALEAAFDAGSTRIHAVRIGAGLRSAITLADVNGVNSLRITGPYGTKGNNHWVNVSQGLTGITNQYLVLEGASRQVRRYDADFNELGVITLGPELDASVDGVCAGPVFMDQLQLKKDIRVLGTTSGNASLIQHYDQDGVLVPEDTVDITGFLEPTDTVMGINHALGGADNYYMITTNLRALFIDISSPATPELRGTIDYQALGIVSPDIAALTGWVDMSAAIAGDDPGDVYLYCLDKTAKVIYRIVVPSDASPELMGSVDVSGIITVDTEAAGLAMAGLEVDRLLILQRRPLEAHDQVYDVLIDWDADPSPTLAVQSTFAVGSGTTGLGEQLAGGAATTTLTMEDRNQSPPAVQVYEASGALDAVTGLLAAVINNGSMYQAELLSSPETWLMPSRENEQSAPDPAWFDPMTGGEDDGEPTNGDYLAGLEATKAVTDTSWVHAVGATSEALWSAILVHCDEMAEDHHAERFAILETLAFTSIHEEGSAEYLTDLQSYVDTIVSRMALVGDRNACVFAGAAAFLDADGNQNTQSIVSGCGGTMAGLEVQKSLINKPVRGVLKLVPGFSPAHIQSLIQARVNCLRFKPGHGFIIAHSLTAAAPGSDYSRINDLRAVYYGSKAAREAGQPYVGEENDAAGEGLRRLESAMARPLEQMRDAGQIDAFELSAVVIGS